MYPEDKVMASFLSVVIIAALFFWGWALIVSPVITLVATVGLYVAIKKVYPYACEIVDNWNE